jgi:hypothetical protein
MKYFVEPFRYSAISQIYNGGDAINKMKNRRSVKQIIDELDQINKKNTSCTGTSSDKINSESYRGEEEITTLHKWIIAFFLGILFFILSSPMFVNISNHLTGNTTLSLLINTIIFILFVRIILI